jgi:hypothetical protein
MPIVGSFAGASARAYGLQTGGVIAGLQLISTKTFSAVSDVDFDNVFSNDYVQYKVVVDLSSAGGEFRAQWRASGSDITASNYTEQYIYYRGTTISGARGTGDILYELGHISANDMLILEISNPFQTLYASLVLMGTQDAETASIGGYIAAHGYKATTSFDGIRFFPQSGTFSGTISIYGYYKGA